MAPEVRVDQQAAELVRPRPHACSGPPNRPTSTTEAWRLPDAHTGKAVHAEQALQMQPIHTMASAVVEA